MRKNSFGYDLHSRIIIIWPSFDRPAILSYSDQNKGGSCVCIPRSRNFENVVALCRRRGDGQNAWARWRNRDSDIGYTSVRYWVLAMNINVLKQLNRRRAGGLFTVPLSINSCNLHRATKIEATRSPRCYISVGRSHRDNH